MYLRIVEEVVSNITIKKNLFFKKEYFVIEDNNEILAIICDPKYKDIVNNIYPNEHYLKSKYISKIILDFNNIEVDCGFYSMEVNGRIYNYNDLVDPRKIYINKYNKKIIYDVYFVIKSININSSDNFIIEPFSTISRKSLISNFSIIYLKKIFLIIYNLMKIINDNVEILKYLISLSQNNITISLPEEIKLMLKH